MTDTSSRSEDTPAPVKEPVPPVLPTRVSKPFPRRAPVGRTVPVPRTPEKPSKIKGILLLSMLILIVAMIAFGFFRKNSKGDNVWVVMLQGFGLWAKPEKTKPVAVAPPVEEKKPETPVEPKPEPEPEPKPETPPEPKPQPKPAGGYKTEVEPAKPTLEMREVHPWGRAKTGAWVRHAVVVRTGAERTVEFVDTGLTKGGASTDETGMLTRERNAKGEIVELTMTDVRWKEGAVVGEETLTVGGKAMKCTIVERGGAKLWYGREPILGSRLVVRRVEGEKTFAVTSVAMEILQVGSQRTPCTRYEAEEPGGERVTGWVSESVPGAVVKLKRISDGRVETRTLIAHGDDWERRPLFPDESAAPSDEETAKAEEKKEPAPMPEPAPEPAPAPEAKPEEAPAGADLQDHPWAKEKVGSWYRVRASVAGMDAFTDTGLAEKGRDFIVLVTQTHVAGASQEPTRTRIDLKSAAAVGEETVEVDGQKLACRVYQAGGVKSWSVKEGPFKGVVVRVESDGLKQRATKLSTERLRVKDRTFECVVADIEREAGGAKSSERTWSSAQCPVGIVKSEGAESSYALVDYGDDWEKRPAPDTARREEPKPEPKPEPKDTSKDEAAAAADKAAKSQKLQDEGTALLKEAVPLFVEVRRAADEPPKSRDEILRKADQCEKKLYSAQLKFTLAEKDAADPAGVKKYVGQIDGLLKKLAEYKKKLK